MAATWKYGSEAVELYEAPGASRFELSSHGYEDADIETVIQDSTQWLVTPRERANRE